jgi:hypothetical protein
MTRVVALFLMSIKIEERIRNRGYSPNGDDAYPCTPGASCPVRSTYST